MTYAEAITTLEQSSKRKKLYPIYLRLERLNLLFKSLAIDPAMPSVHIAGTSGKGSTSALAAAVLQEAGYVVGLHTTPHLQTPRERMQVNGQLPTELEFADLVDTVYTKVLEIEDNNSYGAFNSQEILFAIAALHFSRQNVDIAIVETFMGGQYDPTNVIRPLLSVITNVDLDHTKLLGKTVESIAMVKAGVIKPETPFLTSATQASVLRIFEQRCQDLNAPYIAVGEENTYKSRLLGLKGSLLSATVLNNLFANLHLNLLGKHQINNALLVLYIIQILRARGWLIEDIAIRQAFAHAFIPGRLEIIQQEPMIILDGAHNPAKSRALATSLRRIFKNKKVVFVFGIKRGKDLTATLKPLLPLAAKFIVTRFSEKKARSTAIVARAIREKGIPVTVRVDPVDALKLAKKQVKKDQYVCVTGSLYLVGKLRDQWYPYHESHGHGTIEDIAWPSLAGEPVRQSEVRDKEML
jgi:dihydrofolate synthase/folylpolyglutamate synthase